jgi:chaperonin GroEL
MGTNKKIIFGDKARSGILKGVQTLFDAVKITMGPRGQNVVIERPGMSPHLTKDGVTVAKSINLRERFPNLGAQMVKESASVTADTAGDGTTAATVLSHAIFSEGLKMLSAGYSSSELRKGIERATEIVIDSLKKMTSPISSDDEIVQVGTISANGDKNIGTLLLEAMKSVGRDGVITIEEAKGFKTSLDIVEGMEIDRGYLSPYFVSNSERMTADLINPYIILINKKVVVMQDVLPILEKVHESGRSLMVIADDIEGDALQGLVVNKMKGTLSVCAIRSPEFGEARIHALQDLAIVLGTTVYSGDLTKELKEVTLNDLGQCKRISSGKSSTVFIDANGSAAAIDARVSSIRSYLSTPDLLDPERDSALRRLQRLAGGVAILRVGGATEIELRERKDRVEDALHATQAAVAEGILPGGGVALVRASKALGRLKEGGASGHKVGMEIVRKACESPMRQIVQNSGGTPDVVLARVHNYRGNKGYDARSGKFVDMLETGIIDPLKVIRCALENASSTACSLLSVGCAVVEDEKLDDHTDTMLIL